MGRCVIAFPMSSDTMDVETIRDPPRNASGGDAGPSSADAAAADRDPYSPEAIRARIAAGIAKLDALPYLDPLTDTDRAEAS